MAGGIASNLLTERPQPLEVILIRRRREEFADKLLLLVERQTEILEADL
jgi:hypothetical protein